MPSLLARVCPRGTGDGTRALGLGLTAPLVPWLVCAPYARAAAGRGPPPGTSWGLCLPALAPLYAPKPPLPLGGPAWELGIRLGEGKHGLLLLLCPLTSAISSR